MKRNLLIAVLAIATTLTVSAGNHKGNRIDRLSEKLDLTADQRTKIEAIIKEEHQRVKPVVSQRIREVLNADQQTKFDEMLKKMESRKQGHKKN